MHSPQHHSHSPHRKTSRQEAVKNKFGSGSGTGSEKTGSEKTKDDLNDEEKVKHNVNDKACTGTGTGTHKSESSLNQKNDSGSGG